MKILNWGLAILIAAFFVMMGSQKFMGANPIFQYIAEHSGIGLFEPGVRMLTGAAEIAAALLILLPRTRTLGALLAIAVLAGAIVFHLSPWLGISVSTAFTADGGYGEKTPMIFIMAVSFLVLSAGLLFIQRKQAATA